MTHKLLKGILAGTIGLVAILPAFANVTDLTIKATVADYQLLRLEDAVSGLNVVTTDHDTTQETIAALDKTIGFGTIDALGFSNGLFDGAGAGTAVTGAVEHKWVNDSNVLVAADPGALHRAGAVYFMNSTAFVTGTPGTGLQLRSVTSGGRKVKVEVKNNSDNGVGNGNFIAIATSNSGGFANGDALVKLLADGSNSVVFKDSIDSNAVVPVSVGLYLPLSQVKATDGTATLTFTSTIL